jgi:hypothetical protein
MYKTDRAPSHYVKGSTGPDTHLSSHYATTNSVAFPNHWQGVASFVSGNPIRETAYVQNNAREADIDRKLQTTTTYNEKFDYRGKEMTPNGTEEILPHTQNELRAGFGSNKPRDTLGSTIPQREQGYISADAIVKKQHINPITAENGGSGPVQWSTQTSTVHGVEALAPTHIQGKNIKMCNPQSGFINVLSVVDKQFGEDLKSTYNREFVPKDNTVRPNPPIDFVRIQPNETSYSRGVKDEYALTNDAGVGVQLDKEKLEKIRRTDPTLYNKMMNPDRFATTTGENFQYYPAMNMITNPQDQQNVRMEGSGFTLEKPLTVVSGGEPLSNVTTTREVFTDHSSSFHNMNPPRIAALDAAGRVTAYARAAIIPEEWPNPEEDYKRALERPENVHPSVVEVMSRQDRFLMEDNPHQHKQRG